MSSLPLEFPGHHTNRDYYKSGIISPEYQNIGKRWRGGTEIGIAEAEIHR